MISALTILLFLVVWAALYYQIDNKPATKPAKDTRKSLDELYPPIPPSIYDTIAERKQAYLKSLKWNTIRKQILARDHYTCQNCGISNVSLEVHHITYARFENESPADLVSVCRDCHQDIHNLYGYNYRTTFNLTRNK